MPTLLLPWSRLEYLAPTLQAPDSRHSKQQAGQSVKSQMSLHTALPWRIRCSKVRPLPSSELLTGTLCCPRALLSLSWLDGEEGERLCSLVYIGGLWRESTSGCQVTQRSEPKFMIHKFLERKICSYLFSLGHVWHLKRNCAWVWDITKVVYWTN